MHSRLTPTTALLLIVPPLMWAGNAVVGRMVGPLVPPMTLNLLRWALAFVLLLPLAAPVLRPDSGLWAYWRRFALLGLLSVGAYNALQYLALHTSTPINVTLVAASGPVWMLAIIAWSFYSWMLTQPGKEPPHIRQDWAAFLLAQIFFGLGWSALFAAGEWALTDARIVWSWPLAGALLFVALGPALLAYRCWGAGIQRAGPTMAGFFANLTPLFAALLSAALLSETPRTYHVVAFVLIVGGIVVSSRR